MSSPTFLPVLPSVDIERAAQLIQQAYAPEAHLSSEDQRRIQQELFDIQKLPEAWGLVVPFLDHPDPNVQFFGAHTAQVKIARDWASFPQENALQLRDMLINLTGHSCIMGRPKIAIRKLFVAITSLALKIATSVPNEWQSWLVYSVNSLSVLGTPSEHLLNFLEIAAEEIEGADLIGPTKGQMKRSLLEAVPIVIQAIGSCLAKPRPHFSPNELRSALKCFESWIPILPASDLIPLIPQLLALLEPVSAPPAQLEFDEDAFVLGSDALQEIMAKSALSDGSGLKTLTEPLLLWLDRCGAAILQATLSKGFVDTISHSLCKLLVAIGDHSTNYLAVNIASLSAVGSSPVSLFSTSPHTRSQLIQLFLQLMLGYTGLPGYYGIDEEESEMTLGFWYLFQEALWSVDFHIDEEDTDAEVKDRENDQWNISRAVYSQLVRVLRMKVVWPAQAELRGWTRDQRDKFQTYRRDVGDTLINAYYVLRNDMLGYYVNDVAEQLSNPQNQGWEEMEGTLHCIMAIQEAIPLEDNPHLGRLFSSEIVSRLPTTGSARVRRTALLLIGTYASWFTTQPTHSRTATTSSLLLAVLSYVVAALPDAVLCLPAANALRDLCDANRTALAPHISAFGELHAGLVGIPDTEKSKVLQSIASVIQALPSEEAIPPIEAILNPVVAKLFEALQSAAQLPDEARTIAIQQLQTIAGVARGLTRTSDSLLVLDETPELLEESARMQRARDDPRVKKLREGILNGSKITVDLWCTDASVCDALSDLFKAITALPSDITLLSLSPAPLLELVCVASQRQLTAVWLSLATMLLILLDPPPLIPTTFKPIPNSEAQEIAFNVLAVLLQTSLRTLSQWGSMEANPDIVQAFFDCLNKVTQYFVSAFYRLPPDMFNTLMQCTTTSLTLQERYSLVAACTFLGALITRTSTIDELNEAKMMLAHNHGHAIMKAIINGLVGAAPRSATPNLIELLFIMTTKFPSESRVWMTQLLYSTDLVPSKATNEAKDGFIKSVFSHRTRRARDAAQQFVLIARGLEGSSFGYSSVTM